MSQNRFMRRMPFEQTGRPIALRDCPIPEPRDRRVQLQLLACAVCRTDLHRVEGELPNPKLPLIIGHEIVGRGTRVGEQVSLLSVGQRIGVP
jgi:alcohol dehydrogenase, propanol-preferring